MAFSCDHIAMIEFRSYLSKNVVSGARGTNVLLKSLIFPANLRVGSANFCLKDKKRGFRVRNEVQPSVGSELSNIGIKQDIEDVLVKKEAEVKDLSYSPNVDNENGGGDFPPRGGGGGGNGGNGDGEGDSNEDDEFGPLLKFDDVIREIEAKGATLPEDMLEAAKTIGIRELILSRYLDMQGSAWPLGFAMRSCSMFRNLMLADPSFLFKVGTEIIIDTCCATFAEVQKRGKDFWAEFELYTADLLVGTVVNIALVAMLAPYARIGRPSASKGFLGRMARAYGALPSSVFEAERPGCKFSVRQRIETYVYKGFLYGSVGFVCGLIGQGIANLIMTAKRTVKKSEEDVPIPPLLNSATLWGVFLAVSSNTRYQIINGLERVVEASPMARRAPPVAMAFTVGVRFANNVYGGMQFVDWARWSGVQ